MLLLLLDFDVKYALNMIDCGGIIVALLLALPWDSYRIARWSCGVSTAQLP